MIHRSGHQVERIEVQKADGGRLAVADIEDGEVLSSMIYGIYGPDERNVENYRRLAAWATCVADVIGAGGSE